MKVQIYVCPKIGCGNYFGSSSAGDLTKEFSGPKTENKHALHAISGSSYRNARSDCPSCLQRGVRTTRELVTIDIELPPMRTPPPPLPAY